jgi:group I intron endonuclease
MVIPWEGLFMRGIYLWTNLINGKKYVGKSENIQKRKRSYKDEIKKDSSRYIIKAMKKHGLENFKFEILEKIENDINILEKEQLWMDHYDTMDKNKGYNVLKAEETPGESFSKGSKNNKAKLTEEDVLEIRKKNLYRKNREKTYFFEF